MRRSGLAVGAIGALVLGGVPPATADPLCEAVTFGVDAEGHVEYRQVTNTAEPTWAFRLNQQPLGFAPTTMTLSGFDDAADGYAPVFLATAADRRLREVRTVTSWDDPQRTTVRVVTARTPTIAPRAMTRTSAHGTAFVYAVSAGGTLRRYRPAARATLSHAVRVRGGLAGVQVLAAHTRERVRGAQTDVLLATTVDGALIEILVPLHAPRRPRTVQLAATGFAAYDGIGATGPVSCNGDEDGSRGFLAVDRDADVAQWYSLGRYRVATSSDLRPGAQVPGTWRLHPFF